MFLKSRLYRGKSHMTLSIIVEKTGNMRGIKTRVRGYT